MKTQRIIIGGVAIFALVGAALVVLNGGRLPMNMAAVVLIGSAGLAAAIWWRG